MVVFALPTKRFWAFCAALEFAIHGEDTFEDATAVVVMLDGDREKERERKKVETFGEKKYFKS